MPVVCGTDFSPPAAGAVRVAALLAKSLGEPLALVHVIDELGADVVLRNNGEAFNSVRTRLRAEASQAKELGVDVTEELVAGDTADTLASIAAKGRAHVVVVASTGRRGLGRWLLGSDSERLARRSERPLLVVRDAAPFEEWLSGSRPLRVVVGADATESSQRAVRWVEELRRIGPCDVTIAQIARPPSEHDRLGIPPPPDGGALHPDAAHAILRDARTRVGELAGTGDVHFVVRNGPGPTDHELATLAAEARADLIVVGTHDRSVLDRVWRGSVSRGVLRIAPMSVASVPPRVPLSGEVGSVAPVRQILAATDFSETGDRAVSHALAMIPAGGKLHIVHVLEPRSNLRPLDDVLTQRPTPLHEQRVVIEEARKRLSRVVPHEAASRGVVVTLDVLEGDVAEELCRAAERLGVDAVCVGSRGRSALAAVLLGSVTQSVLARSKRAVVVVPPQDG